MAVYESLSASEMSSLREVAKGVFQQPIPQPDVSKLLELGLVYWLLGGLRVTAAGRARTHTGYFQRSANSNDPAQS